jgi:Sugar (pentulose and hexulose) kinases
MVEAINRLPKKPDRKTRRNRITVEPSWKVWLLSTGLVVEELSQVTGLELKRIHLIGGGAKNHLLNQFTAEATGLTVLAGPEEATSAGNVLVQALAAGILKNQEEIRTIVRNSFEIKKFQPEESQLWEARYADFLEILERARKLAV